MQQNIPNANLVKNRGDEFSKPTFILLLFLASFMLKLLIIELSKLVGKFLLAMIRLVKNIFCLAIIMLVNTFILILGLIALSIGVLVTVLTHRPSWYRRGI